MSAPVLTIDRPLKQGDHGPIVRELQEWLCLWLANPYPARVDDRELACTIDGEFGPQTAAAVRRVEQALGWREAGEVDRALWGELVRPLATALLTPLARDTLAETVVATARIHLKQGPREVGGDNRGPFVRQYCGVENVPWCAGFATSIVAQAALLMQKPPPVPHELSCDIVARDADMRGILVHDSAKPGDLLLVKAPPGNASHKRYHHIAIVTDVSDGIALTVEGNSNDTGSREGWCVIAHRRPVVGHDFVSMSPASPRIT